MQLLGIALRSCGKLASPAAAHTWKLKFRGISQIFESQMFFAGHPFLIFFHNGRFHPLIHMFLFGFELSFFTVLAYIAGYCVILFLAVSLACGLYYLAELTEEYPSITKKVIKISIYQSAASLLLLFFFDDFPWMETIFTLGGCFLYHKLMQSFPLINFSSPLFIGSMVSFVIQNMMWCMPPSLNALLLDSHRCRQQVLLV
jgi:hypothetical protein